MSEAGSFSRKRKGRSSANGNSIASSFEALSKALEEREKDLDAREEDLECRERLAQAACPGTPSDVIHLNVGGRTGIAVTRRTLMAIPGSMLESRFSGRWDDSIEKDDDGKFFIDEDPDLFLTMINCLRAKAKYNDPKYPPGSPAPRIDLDRLLSYYGTLHAIYPMSLERQLGEASGVQELQEDCPNFSVATTSDITFKLSPSNAVHQRRICQYRIKLGNFRSAQNWMDRRGFSDRGRQSLTQGEVRNFHF